MSHDARAAALLLALVLPRGARAVLLDEESRTVEGRPLLSYVGRKLAPPAAPPAASSSLTAAPAAATGTLTAGVEQAIGELTIR